MSFPDGLPVPTVLGISPTVANGYVKDAADQVKAVMALAQGYATSAVSQANTAISAMANFKIPTTPAPTVTPPAAITIDGSFSVTPPTGTTFGTVTAAIPGMSGFGEIPLLANVDIPDFHSSISSINIPTAPAPLDTSGLPSHPSINMSVTLPDKPAINDPAMPTLAQITIPTFVFPTLPTFDALPPEFAGTPVSTVLNWVEPTYAPQIMGDVLTQVRRYFAGGTGIPPAIEQQIFDRAISREDVLVIKAVAEATEMWSSRGFTVPPGMLVEQVSLIQQDALVKKQAGARELVIQVATWEIENLRFAVQQGIAAENLLVNIFLALVQRAFEVAKYQVEAAITMYKIQVELFNARQQAYSVQAQVYKTRLDGELAKLEVYKAEIEGAKALAQLNTQQVQLYSAMLQGVMTRVEVYKAEMEGAQIQSNLIKNQIDIYKTDVEAYATKVSAGKVVFEAYDSQVRAEASKAGIIDAEARAFAATIEGKKATIEAGKIKVDAAVEMNRSAVMGYTAQIEAVKAQISAQAATIDAAARAYEAGTHAYSAQAEAQSQMSRAKIAGATATAQIAEMSFGAQIKQYEVQITAIIQQAGLLMEGLKGAAQTSSSLAAAAMSASHVSAQISGSGQVGSNTQASVSSSNTTAVGSSRSYSIESTEAGGVP